MKRAVLRAGLRAFLFCCLSIVLTLAIGLASHFAQDYVLRARISPLNLIATGQNTAASPAPISGTEADWLREHGVILGCYRLQRESAGIGGPIAHVNTILAEPQLFKIVGQISGESSLELQQTLVLTRPDEVILSPSFAQRLRLSGLSPEGKIAVLSGRGFTIRSVLSAREAAILKLLGLSADVYRPIDRENWTRSNVRPYSAIVDVSKGAGMDSGTILRQAMRVQRPTENSSGIQLTPALEVTLGPWRRAVEIVLTSFIALGCLILCAIWTVQHNYQISIGRDFWIRQVLGSSRTSLVLLNVRGALIPALIGSVCSAVIIMAILFGWPVLGSLTEVTLQVWLLATLIMISLAALAAMISFVISVPKVAERVAVYFMPAGFKTRNLIVGFSSVISTLLLIVAVTSVQRLATAHQDYFIGDPDNLVRLYVFLSLDQPYRGSNPEVQFRQDMQREFESLRGTLRAFTVDGQAEAGYPSAVHQAVGRTQIVLLPDGKSEIDMRVRMITVSPGYFRVLGLPLLWGSTCPDHASGGSQTGVLVNEAFLRYAGLSDYADPGQLRNVASRSTHSIIGVVADTSSGRPAPASPATVFHCDFSNAWEFYFRPVGNPSRSLEDAIAAVRQKWPAAELDGQVVGDEVEGALGHAKSQAQASGFFAAISGLAALVTLAVIALQTVYARRRSSAIRMALGGTRVAVIRAIVGPLAVSMSAGILAGAGIAALLMTWAYSTNYLGVSSGRENVALIIGGAFIAMTIPLLLVVVWTLDTDITGVLREE